MPANIIKHMTSRTLILFCAIIGGFFFLLYIYAEQSHIYFFQKQIEEKSGHFARFLESSLNERLVFVTEYLQQTYADSAPRSLEEHLKKTQPVLAANPFLLTINYLDENGVIRFIAPPTAKKEVIGPGMILPAPAEALAEVEKQDRGILSRPYSMIQGGIGYSLIIKDGRQGFYEIVFTAQKTFADFLNQYHLEYQLQDAGVLVMETPLFFKQYDQYRQFAARPSFNILNRSLQLKALPAADFSTLRDSHWPLLAKIGLLLSFFFFIIISALQMRANKERQQANNDLERLVRQRTEEYERANELLTQEFSAHQISQKELKQNEEHLQLVLEGSEAGIWDWDIKSDKTSFNERWAAMLEFSLRDINFQDSFWKKLIHPDDLAAVNHELQRHLNGESGLYECEYRMRTKHGTWKWIQATGKVVAKDPQGAPLRMTGIHLDISSRKQAESNLIQQYQLQAALNSLLALSLQDLNLEEFLEQFLRIVTTMPWLGLEQPGAIFLFEKKSSRLILSAQHRLHPDLHTSCAQLPLGACLCGRAAASRAIVFADQVDERHSITTRDMESHGHYCVPFFSSRQELLGVFTVYLKAGSQREEHVEKALTAATQVLANILERKKSEKESEESQKRYREVVEGTGDLITWMSPEGRLTFVNHMAPTIFGLPPEESNGKSIFDFVHPEDRLRAEEWFQQCIAHKTAQGTIENRLVNQKTGESHYLLWTANFHYDEEGQLSGVSGVGRDITERHARETLLQQSKNTLQKMVEQRTAELQETHLQLLHAEKLSAIGRLSASIAHEFNNPLFGVLNVLDSVKRYVPLTENFTTLLDMANRECLRMKELIRDLQDFNRPTSGIRAPMDIHQTTDAILLLSKKEFKNRNITVQKDFSQDLPLINAIADQIKQVLLNLLTNAVDACEAKGGTIGIRTSMHGKNVAIAIQDTGNGIKPEHMNHIFEPFFTTKPGVKGTGLGLSVSYGIIKRHGGRIEVNSEVGNGSTFTILLPIK